QVRRLFSSTWRRRPREAESNQQRLVCASFLNLLGLVGCALGRRRGFRRWTARRLGALCGKLILASSQPRHLTTVTSVLFRHQAIDTLEHLLLLFLGLVVRRLTPCDDRLHTRKMRRTSRV